MNIVKLQKQLQNVPDNALVGYVKNPDGQVPSYLALTELNRRKELRKDYEQQAAPEKSVAESMVDEASGIQGLPQAPQGQPAPQQMAQAPQQPMPQEQPPQQMAGGGLAELDIPDDMFNEESYAAGGIVAFGDGGGVQRFDGTDGSFVKLSRAEFDKLRPYEKTGYINQFGAPPSDSLVPLSYAEFNQLIPAQKQSYLQQYGTAPQKPQTQQIMGAGQPANALMAAMNAPSPSNSAVNTNTKTLVAGNPNQVQPAPVVDPTKQLPVVDPTKQLPGPDLTAGPQVGGITYNMPNLLKDIKVPERAKIDEAKFVGEAPGLSAILASQKEAYDAKQVSEKPYENVISSIAQQREDLGGKNKDRAIGEFLMNLGFGAASGKSKDALTNFSQAAGPAGKELIGTMKELEARKDKLNEREFAVLDAQNKFRQTGADSALKELTSREAERRTAEREYVKTDALLQESDIGRKYSLQKDIATEQGRIATAALNYKLQDAGLRIQSFSAETQRMAHNKPDQFSATFDLLNSDEKFKTAPGTEKAKMLNEALYAGKAGGGDNTLRQKAGDSVDKVLEGANPIATKWKQLLKEDPTGAKAATYKDALVLEELRRRKQDVSGGATASTNAEYNYDPKSSALVPFTR